MQRIPQQTRQLDFKWFLWVEATSYPISGPLHTERIGARSGEPGYSWWRYSCSGYVLHIPQIPMNCQDLPWWRQTALLAWSQSAHLHRTHSSKRWKPLEELTTFLETCWLADCWTCCCCHGNSACCHSNSACQGYFCFKLAVILFCTNSLRPLFFVFDSKLYVWQRIIWAALGRGWT